MEDRLQRLIRAANPENRDGWAAEWQRKGGKVVGILGSYVPEEVVHAAGMLPWRVVGRWEGRVELARVYRPTVTCAYGTRVLEGVLRGEFDFLDGVIGTDRDQDLVRTWDVWVSLGKPVFSHMMHVPHKDSPVACREFNKDITELAQAIERCFGARIDDDTLRQSAKVYEYTRQMLRHVYELRRREIPPLSGAESLGLTLAATVMPREQFNAELAELLPYIEQRRSPLTKLKPRVMVAGEMFDNPGYLELVEAAGCLVAMDDLDTGSRYFWGEVDAAGSDIRYALAKGYLQRPAAPHLSSWGKQVDQMVEWVREFDIDGVVQLVLVNDKPTEMRAPFVRTRLADAGIPFGSFDREYSLENIGQLRTRLEAFIEMLES